MVSVQRHLALLRGALRDGEQEQLWIRAEQRPSGYAGALLVTDVRLLFCGLGFVQQSQEAWPLDLVAVEQVQQEGRRAEVTVQVPGGTERFAGRTADIDALVAHLPASVAGPSDGLAGELERLAALHAAGALTAAEYETAKRRLLG